MLFITPPSLVIFPKHRIHHASTRSMTSSLQAPPVSPGPSTPPPCMPLVTLSPQLGMLLSLPVKHPLTIEKPRSDTSTPSPLGRVNSSMGPWTYLLELRAVPFLIHYLPDSQMRCFNGPGAQKCLLLLIPPEKESWKVTDRFPNSLITLSFSPVLTTDTAYMRI